MVRWEETREERVAAKQAGREKVRDKGEVVMRGKESREGEGGK